jgi:hypothetical protein
MLKNNNSQEPTNLVVVPAQLVDEIKQLLNEIKLNQSSQKEVNTSLGEFISEKEARKILDRKTTWFYEQRRSGRLPYSKVGSKVYYKRENLFNLLKNN